MAKNIQARVLLDHDGFKINQVVSGAEAQRAIDEGWGDGDPAAVAYAKELGVEGPAEEADADAGGEAPAE